MSRRGDQEKCSSERAWAVQRPLGWMPAWYMQEAAKVYVPRAERPTGSQVTQGLRGHQKHSGFHLEEAEGLGRAVIGSDPLDCLTEDRPWESKVGGKGDQRGGD